MKKMLGLLIFILLTGCSTPGKPAFYYTWTQYSTSVNIQLINEPEYKTGFQGILRLDDKSEYALMVIYNGGSVASHFGYVEKNNLEDWINIYAGFFKWDPKDPNQKVKFTIMDNVSLFQKDYDVEYRLVQGRKLFVINKHRSDNWFVDFSELAMDENNVQKLLGVYEDLRQSLK